MRILIVEDDPDIRELITYRLENYCFEVESASDGVEAFNRLRENPPDLIILDVLLPVMDGYALVNELQWHPDLKRIPIIVLSAKPDTADLFAESGVRSFVEKPFRSEDLLEQVYINLN